jgi:hypothetical protein
MIMCNIRTVAARLILAALTLALSFSSAAAQSAASIQTPSQFLGFEVGADRTLADYKQIVSYFSALASSSNRIEIENLGPTTLGNDMIMAIISSEENLKNKEKYREIARTLADPRGRSQTEIDELAREGKAIVLVTCDIHASEIGSTQMAMEWAYGLATAQDAETKRRLENVILLLVPSLNPDGQIMEVEWYRKYLGTKYEGGRMPWLYHHYVGHDNNRDWYMLTQKETKAMNRATFLEWFPQVWLDEHQMGSTGPRIFVPPFSSPVSPNLHPLLWRPIDQIGTTMAWRLEEQRKAGVIYGYSYDAYWPGGTMNTAWWKNCFGLLTEVASVRLATPVEVEPGELSGGSKGLIEYRQQTNFPNPWPGGAWRLRDIMDYERIASDALLETCSNYRESILRDVAMMAMDAVKSGDPNTYYKISLDQQDPPTAARLAHLIRENGAEVLFSPQSKTYYIPAAQPYAKFLSEVLGIQRYPRVKLVAGENILPPYDMTAWSLPLMMGVQVEMEKLSAGAQRELRPLQEADGPTGSVANPTASVFAVSHETNNATRLINDLLRKEGKVSVAHEGFQDGGRSFPAGTVLLQAVGDPEALARTYSLELYGLSRTPSAKADRLHEARVALYKPWQASMDEGWTRWVLEQYDFNYKNIDNKDAKATTLSRDFDVVLLPDVSKDIIVDGKRKPREGQSNYFQDLPPEYSGGIGKEGTKNLKEFVEKGGTLVALGSACDFVIDEFNIPVVNTLARTRSEEFNCPGSILRAHIDPGHPVTYGMPEEAAVFVNERIAFRTSVPGPELTRTVLASYPDDAEDILLSGWILGAEKLERRAAALALTYGKGKLVLFGFRVQHRAQTEGTYKMLFNALQWAGMEESK